MKKSTTKKEEQISGSHFKPTAELGGVTVSESKPEGVLFLDKYNISPEDRGRIARANPLKLSVDYDSRHLRRSQLDVQDLVVFIPFKRLEGE